MATIMPGGARRPSSSRRGLGRPATVVIVLALVLAGFMLLALAGAVVYTLQLDRQYDQAVAALERKDYTGAIGSLSGVPEFFREKTSLQDYARAGELLGKGDYDGARRQFERLKDFRDSRAMVTETDYLHAKALLETKDYQGAADLLEGLAKQSHQDSADLLMEAQYALAVQKLNAKEYEQAAELLQRLAAKKYKGAEDLLRRANYCQAVELYREGQYAQAQALLADLDAYEKSDAYYLLTQLQLKQYKITGYAGQVAAMSKLLALGKAEDFVSLLTGDEWICFLLSGIWVNGDNYFVMTHDDSGFNINYALPYVNGKYYYIEDSVLYVGSDETGWDKCFQFKFESERIMVVHCYKDGADYKLYRSLN